MKQYGIRFTYFVSLLVSGYLFWGWRIYIDWPIKWPLGVFNGGAAWSLLALANVCICVIEYFMGQDDLLQPFYWFRGFVSAIWTIWTSAIWAGNRHTNIIYIRKHLTCLERVYTEKLSSPVFSYFSTCVYRLHLSVDCLYSAVDIYPLFQQAEFSQRVSFISSMSGSRGIIPIQAEMASLSFLFFSADGVNFCIFIILGDGRRGAGMYRCSLSGSVDCVAESKLELLGCRVEVMNARVGHACVCWRRLVGARGSGSD